MLTLIALMQWGDALTTYIALTTKRGSEGNGLVAEILTAHPWLAFPIKIALIALIIWTLRSIGPGRLRTYATLFVLMWSAAVVISNVRALG